MWTSTACIYFLHKKTKLWFLCFVEITDISKNSRDGWMTEIHPSVQLQIQGISVLFNEC